MLTFPANRLVGSTSPYLLQHAHNPVDWQPWDEAALSQARQEDKPIFLSIGYSSCHWCHVMAHESFENAEVAAFLKEHFVCIKVDREERPDLDDLYMGAVQAMTGRGGWPMSVWLTPDLKPFYGGTYFPPEPRYGMPSFRMLLERLAAAWRDKREAVLAQAQELTNSLAQEAAGRPGQGLPREEVFGRALNQLRGSFDSRWGGFGPAPKFPAHMAVALLLRRGADEDKAMAWRTLDAMWEGGMFDHLGGGFARYSVDGQWLIPHFEKMLYDNALLVCSYLEGFQVRGEARYAQVARECLDYLLTDMRDPMGGFHSAEDADSEGVEGKFYAFTAQEVLEQFGPEDASLFGAAFGLSPEGNFEHRGNVLHRFSAPSDLADRVGLEPEALENRLHGLRQRLKAYRNRRVRPGKDDKVLAGWNGLALSALAKGAQALGEARYLAAATACAEFLQRELWRDCTLLRTWRQGKAQIPAFLEDYAAVANGLVDLYETGFEVRWLRWAEALAEEIQRRFLDPEEGGCFSTEAHQEDLLFRQKVGYDGAVPSGNTLAALVFSRLARHLDRSDFREAATGILIYFSEQMARAPRGFLGMLNTLDFHVGEGEDLVYSGPLQDPGTQALLQSARQRFLPRAVSSLVGADPTLPLHQDRNVPAPPRVFPCRAQVCSAPIQDPAGFSAWLEGQKSPS